VQQSRAAPQVGIIALENKPKNSFNTCEFLVPGMGYLSLKNNSNSNTFAEIVWFLKIKLKMVRAEQQK
jgi:hypothetical protein